MQDNLKTLDRYIYEALYDKKIGYYTNNVPFGKKGDFITSPYISILFSEMICIWCILFWKFLNCPKKFNIIELGAGDGKMMYQIINSCKKFKTFNRSTNFFIIEKSENLIKIQRKKLKGLNVKWVKSFKELKNNNCLFLGNEFLDAFPIKQFEKKNSTWFEKYVQENTMANKVKNIKVNLKKYEKKVGFKFYENQTFIEISLDQIKLLKKISSHINKVKGGLLFFDYGYSEQQMYNTLQSVKKHKKVNFLEDKGNIDITHLVNFSLLKKILILNNLKINGFTSQKKFLEKLGIFARAEILSKNMKFLKKADLYYRIKRLTDEKGMGNQFKVIFASSNKINFNYGFD